MSTYAPADVVCPVDALADDDAGQQDLDAGSPGRLRTVEERNHLVEDNLALAGWCLGQLWETNSEVRRLGASEARSVGYLALIRAAQGWDPAKSAFSSYATTVIKRGIVREAVANGPVCRLPHPDSLPRLSPATVALIQQARGNYQPLADELYAKEGWQASEEFQVMLDQLREALPRLSQRQQEVVRLREWENRSWVDIARVLGVSKQAAQQGYARAMEELREAIGGKI